MATLIDDDLDRAEELLHLGRFAEAEQLLRRLLGEHPDSIAVQYALATALLGLERNDEALALAQRALAMDPDDVDCQLLVCDALIGADRAPEAVELAEVATATDPNDWRAWFAHARALGSLEMPRVRDALDSINRAIALAPHEADLHALAGIMLDILGLRDQARAAFTEALRLDPQHTVALTSLADLDAGFFRLRRSAGNVRSAVAADAQDTFAHGGVSTLALRLARRLLLALVLGGIVVGLEVYSGASSAVRATTGVATLVIVALLARSSRANLPRGLTTSPSTLWRGVGVGTKLMLTTCAAITICLCVMAFAPLSVGGDAGLVFLRVIRLLLMIVVFVAIFRAVSLLLIRRR